MKRNTVHFTGNQLHRAIRDSVRQILKEEYSTPSKNDRQAFANFEKPDREKAYHDLSYNSGDLSEQFNEAYNSALKAQLFISDMLDGNFSYITRDSIAKKSLIYLYTYLTKSIRLFERTSKKLVSDLGMQPTQYGLSDSRPNKAPRLKWDHHRMEYKNSDNKKMKRYKTPDLNNPQEDPNMY